MLRRLVCNRLGENKEKIAGVYTQQCSNIITPIHKFFVFFVYELSPFASVVAWCCTVCAEAQRQIAAVQAALEDVMAKLEAQKAALAAQVRGT